MTQSAFTLHGFLSVFGQPSASPFVIKSMVQVALSQADAKLDLTGQAMKAPGGKLPFLEFPDGKKIGDSENIYHYLSRNHGLDLESWLTQEQRAQGHLYARAAEERLYFTTVAYRWRHDENWREIRELYFSQFPSIARAPVAGMIRRKILRDLKGHGLGLHDMDKIYAFAAADLTAIARVLGDQPYLFGESISYADTCVGAQVSGALAGTPCDPVAEVVDKYPALHDYAQRVTKPAHDLSAGQVND